MYWQFKPTFAPINPSGNDKINVVYSFYLISSLMSHEVSKEDQYSWKNIPVIFQGLTKQQTAQAILSDCRIIGIWICERGDCKCIKVTRKKYGSYFTTYSRSGTLFKIEDRPDCFGDTLINQQTID